MPAERVNGDVLAYLLFNMFVVKLQDELEIK